MKKIAFVAILATITAAAVYFQPGVDPSRRGIEDTITDLPKEFSAAEAKKGAALAKQVAAAEIDLPRLPALSKSELEAKIAEIDDHIRGQHYVERSNRGQLSANELLAFRRLLAMRNQYFEQKIDILLNET